jgi:NAD(P)-dependent dehydrogenase (short-subunit alcohol dehydrogenase family)
MSTDAGRPLLGQWSVVTGASKGIGLGIATRFVDAGANVVIVARGVEALKDAGEQLRGRASAAQTIVPLAADTSDRREIAELFRRIRSEVPQLNVFVANAGSGTISPFLELTAEEWDRTLALNLTGTFLCCQEAARLMTKTAAGANKAILVVSSIRAVGVRPGRLAYAVTKAGVNQLVRASAYELAPRDIRVNALSPGITATPLALEGNPEVFEEMAAMVPLGRAGTPDDMAAAALYLCSPEARFVTGANVVVDGGESLW